MKRKWIHYVVFSVCMAVAGGMIADDHYDDRRQPGSAAGLAGTWRVQITIRHCQTGEPLRPPFAALATFGRGGTVITSDSSIPPSLRGVGHGTWEHAPSRRYAAVIEAFLFNPAGVFTGRQRFRQEIAMSGGDHFEADIAAEILNAEGTVIGTGCATSAGERLE